MSKLAACLAVGTLAIPARAQPVAAEPGKVAEAGAVAPLAPPRGPAKAGHWVVGAERLTGLFIDQPSVSGEPTGAMNTTETTTSQTVHLSVLGNQGSTPSSVPRLALDHFVGDAFSVGGSFAYFSASRSQSRKIDADGVITEDDQDFGTTRTFLLEPRVGYAFPFGRGTWGLWARGGLLLAHVSDERRVVNEFDPNMVSVETTQTTTLSLSVEGMFWFSPVRHVAILGGPYVDLGLLGSYSPEVGDSLDARQTSFGLALGLAVFF